MEKIKFLSSTEKAVRQRELLSVLTFVVKSRKTTKQEIANEIKDTFGVNVVKVNTMIDRNGVKKAYVTLKTNDEVVDVVSKLGLM